MIFNLHKRQLLFLMNNELCKSISKDKCPIIKEAIHLRTCIYNDQAYEKILNHTQNKNQIKETMCYHFLIFKLATLKRTILP